MMDYRDGLATLMRIRWKEVEGRREGGGGG